MVLVMTAECGLGHGVTGNQSKIVYLAFNNLDTAVVVAETVF